FFSSRRRHTRSTRDWSSDVCSSDLECFGRGSPAEGFTRSTVELVGHLVQAGLGQAGKAVTFGKVLAEQSVGVFVGAPLPWAAGVAEVDRDPGVDSEAFVLRHLRALIPGQ